MTDAYRPPSPLRIAPGALPLAWWTDPQLNAVRDRAAEAWSAWVRDWVQGAAAGIVDAKLAHQSTARTGDGWIPLGTRGEGAAWLQVRTGAVADVFELLFDDLARLAGEKGIGWATASLASSALSQGLRTALALDGAGDRCAVDPALFKPWSGSVVLSLSVPSHPPVALLLNAACVRALVGQRGGRHAPERTRSARTSLVPLAQALSERKLPLRVELTHCELDFGSLESLRIGDIVPLAHSLEMPLLVATHDVQVCAGFLGRQGGMKAIELTREVPREHEPQVEHHP